jgi:hypothetical protein
MDHRPDEKLFVADQDGESVFTEFEDPGTSEVKRDTVGWPEGFPHPDWDWDSLVESGGWAGSDGDDGIMEFVGVGDREADPHEGGSIGGLKVADRVGPI